MFGVRKPKRFAFVVGNANYEGQSKLNNPINDANAMREKLRDLEFVVSEDTHDDLTFDEFIERFDGFVKQLGNARDIDTVLIYFAGHGYQDNNINYIVPIPDENDEPRSISIQALIEQTSPHTPRCLFYLDACRSYPDQSRAKRQLTRDRDMGTRYIDVRSMVDGAKARFRSDSNEAKKFDQYLAFSAAPGEVAYDGDVGESLSPFTKAVIKEIDSIDLPLSIMMSRVRDRVWEDTNQKQRTWDNSSLRESFFFNPSSVLLLMGNFLSFLACIFAFIFYSWGLLENSLPFKDSIDEKELSDRTISIVAFLILFLAIGLLARGINAAYTRLKGRIEPDEKRENDFWLNLIKQGVIGGITGAIIASWFMGLAFYFGMKKVMGEAAPTIGRLATELTLCGLIVFPIMGVLSLLGYEFFNRRASGPTTGVKSLYPVLGAVVGATIAALLVSHLPVRYFVGVNRFMDEGFWPVAGFLLATPITTFIIIYAIQNFSLEKYGGEQLAASLKAVFNATISTLIIFGLIFIGLYFTGLLEKIFLDLLIFTRSTFQASVVFSLVFGPILGMMIGLTRKWS